MNFVQANTNGRLHAAHEPSLAPLSRGFLYGDAVYEVWRSYHGFLFAWEEHWRRLEGSARGLHLALPLSPAQALAEVRRTAAAHREATGHTGDLYVRLQISRGCGPIGLDVALADRPDTVILVQALAPLPPDKARTGLALSLATTMRRNPAMALDPAWKTGNYLNNLLCLREAKARGADDVVILNLAGEVTEAATSNLAFVRGGELVTPPLSAGILSGITRGLLLSAVAASAGVPVREERIVPGDFPSMDECMLLSTTRDVVPVASIDGARFGVGPESVTARLKAAFAAYARAYAERYPELRVAA